MALCSLLVPTPAFAVVCAELFCASDTMVFFFQLPLVDLGETKEFFSLGPDALGYIFTDLAFE